MHRYLSYAVAAVALIALLVISPHFFSSAFAKPKQVRVIVHEHRLLFESSGCVDQHLKEHLYARLVDKELTDRGYTGFSVDAVATIDKIIIGIEHWGASEGLDDVVSAAAEGITTQPSLDLVEQERGLIEYENGLLGQFPQLGGSVTAALQATEEATQNESCDIEKFRAADLRSVDWKPGEFEVYELGDEGEYTLITSSRAELSTFPNAWDNLAETSRKPTLTSEASSPNTLFVAHRGRANPLLTAELLAGIYDSLIDTGLSANDVRPFGKAGFVMQGEETVLVGIQEEIRRRFNSSSASQLQSNSLRRAWESVCRFSTEEIEENAQLYDERIAHTYFEFSTNGILCAEGLDLLSDPSGLVVISDLVYVPTSYSGPPTYEKEMSFALCIPEERFVREDLSIAAYAMRQYLRYDAGLILNVQFSKIKDNCVNIAVFAPIANTQPLGELLTSFASTDNAYTARYAAATIIFHCSQTTNTPCSKANVEGSITEPPELVVSVNEIENR